MSTSYTPRTPVTTNWKGVRSGGSYLVDVNGNYITDVLGRRIVVIVKGGDLSFDTWTGRNGVTTNYTPRIPI